MSGGARLHSCVRRVRMKMSRRYVVGVTVAASVLALSAAGGIAGTNAAAAPARNHAGAAAGRLLATPPLHHATAIAAAPSVAAAGASPWRRLRNAPPFSPGTMLLASDGSVLVHSEPESGGTSDWYRLTPDSRGNYADGTWSQLASMQTGYDPLYFSSAILPDGRMLVEGGEYLGGNDA